MWVLHCRHAKSPTPATRSALVDEYHDYAVALARRMQRAGEPLEDLVQVAFEALLVAIERFEPERGIPFKGFAKPTIQGSIKRHFRDNGWSMRVPRRVHELAGPVRRETDRLTLTLARTPKLAEVSEAIGVDCASVEEARCALDARAVASIDRMLQPDCPRREPTAGFDADLDRAENHLALQQAIRELTPRERELVRRYFFEERTQAEIARRYGVSQMQVSRWLGAAIRRLQRAMAA